MKKEKYLVLIPALKASKTIRNVMLNLNKLNMSFDVLVIDNHSSDGTLKVV